MLRYGTIVRKSTGSVISRTSKTNGNMSQYARLLGQDQVQRIDPGLCMFKQKLALPSGDQQVPLIL